jgi:uncharacterized protein with NRDE domain
MCLIVFAWKAHPDYPLILVANRDELHARPTKDMHWWPDVPGVLAGRDLQASGSWLAITKSGRFATVTNYREAARRRTAPHSRGDFVRDFAAGAERPMPFVQQLEGGQYAGCSLLASDGDELVYWSNRGDQPRQLDPGIYGLSNASLDTPWPKLVRTRDRLAAVVAENNPSLTTLFRIVADKKPVPATEVIADELPFELARALSAPFIVTPEYGTRCSTALLIGANGLIEVGERRFNSAGERNGDSLFSFSIDRSTVAGSP